MKSTSRFTIIGIIIAVILILGACSAGFAGGWILAPKPSAQEVLALPETSFQASEDTSSASSPVQSADELFKPFWQAWQIVHDQYLVQPVDDEAMMQGAIKGMMESLGDEHSSYMDPRQYEDASSSLSGEYEGIGAWVSTDGEYLTITEPMQGSPAEKAGLKRGDQVIAIDGEDMTGILPELARMKVLGPAGSTVRLTILRAGETEPFDVDLERTSIVVPSVEYEMLDGDIALVELHTFGERSSQELEAALNDIMAQEPKGLIFDLRNNSGGSLTTAIEVASQFIDEGVIAYEEYGDGSRDTLTAIGGGLATEIPMVVLVNEFSASASELVAGALQDYERAPLVGTTTFGKGSVQNWIPLTNDEGAVRVTIARWLTPEERHIHELGLTPDYEVPLTDEDIAAEVDPQLEKAIELLTQ